MMGGGRLPAGYSRLSWIESSGTQAVDTEVELDGNSWWLELELGTTQKTPPLQSLLGGTATNVYSRTLRWGWGGRLEGELYGTIGVAQLSAAGANVRSIRVAVNEAVVIDGDSLAVVPHALDIKMRFGVFGVWRSGVGFDVPGEGLRICTVRGGDATGLKFDFVAALNQATGQAGFYDLVTDSMRYNTASADNFITP